MKDWFPGTDVPVMGLISTSGSLACEANAQCSFDAVYETRTGLKLCPDHARGAGCDVRKLLRAADVRALQLRLIEAVLFGAVYHTTVPVDWHVPGQKRVSVMRCRHCRAEHEGGDHRDFKHEDTCAVPMAERLISARNQGSW